MASVSPNIPRVPAAIDWRTTILSPDGTVQDAIASLNSSSLQIVLVVAADGRFVGTITDGDIRRALLRGATLRENVMTITQRDSLIVPPEMGYDAALQLMRANRIHQLPIVDNQHQVIGLHLMDHVASSVGRPNVMVIMAGGVGSRLMPHTQSIPKPMVQVGQKPMLEHIIERARLDGFSHFVLAVHHLGHLIEDYFGNGDRWRVRIDYLREIEPLGTAGALGLFSERPTLPILVSNGDVLTDVRYGDLIDYHDRHDAAATMAVRLYEWQHPFGVVRTQGIDIVSIDEKPVARTPINAGMCVLDPAVLYLLDRGQRCDMPTLFDRVREAGRRTIVYPIHEPWLDVGRPADLLSANSASRGQGS
jgi:dTDP-glucose pyrophosphorylase/predicted transcriptional regulator